MGERRECAQPYRGEWGVEVGRGICEDSAENVRNLKEGNRV